MPDAPPTPARPLLVYPGAIGDLIRLTAVARGLERRWGGPCDLVARHVAAPEVFAGLDSVAELAHLPSRSRPFPLDPVQWGLVRWLRERGPTPVYLLEERVHRVAPWRRETRMEWLLGRAGVGEEHVVAARRHRRDPLEHFVDYGLRLAALDPPAWRGTAPGGTAADGPRPVPELAVSDAELEEARAWLARRDLAGPPLVLLQSGSRKRHRGRWPVERWRRLVAGVLAAEPEARVLVLGTAGEAGAVAELVAACDDPRVVGTAGELPLRRLFAVMTGAHSAISLDTGPAHAAAALGCPVAVIVGSADPRRNRPVGPPQRVQVITAWPEERWPASPDEWVARHQTAEVAVDDVLAAWRRLENPP